MSLASELAEGYGQFYVAVEIEGVGSVISGTPRTWKLCSRKPAWSTAGDEYRDWLKAWPDSIPQLANIFGGRVSSSELSIEAVDGTDDDDSRFALTAKLRDDAPVIARLVGGINAGAGAITLDSAALSIGQLVYIGNEAMVVTGGANPYNVTRAQLGTIARSHYDNDKVFTDVPYIRSRRMRLYYGNAAGSSAGTDEAEIGQSWYLDTADLQRGLLAWTIRGRSQDKFLERRICSIYDRRPRDIGDSVIAWGVIAYDLNTTDGAFEGTGQSVFTGLPEVWPDKYRFVLLEEEIVSGRVHNGKFQHPSLRGVAGTVAEEHAAGTPFVEVLVADADLEHYDPNVGANVQVGSFRYQDSAPTGDRTTGTWKVSDHPIVITLCMLMSSASPDDGLELANASGNYDFSSLPAGFGIGIPADQIDIDTFLDIWRRHPEWRSPNTVVGPQELFPNERIGVGSGPAPIVVSELTFAEWYEREFGWTGVILQFNNNKWSAYLPRIPMVNETTTTIGDAQILTEKTGDKSHRPAISASKKMDYLVSRVTFHFKGEDGRPQSVTYRDEDFATVLGQRGFYAVEERGIDIMAPGVRGDPTHPVLRNQALTRLIRYYRPVWEVEADTDLSLYAIAPGTLIALTHAMLVKDGARGWTNEPVIAWYKNPILREGRAAVEWKFIAYGLRGTYARQSPTARIVSVASAGGGNFDITCSANIYTDPTDPLAQTDAGSFNNTLIGSNPLVNLIQRNGVLVSATPQNITSFPGANVLRVNGDFGGTLAAGVGNAGQRIIFAERDAVGLQAGQYTNYVYLGGTNGTIGASGQANFKYGEA